MLVGDFTSYIASRFPEDSGILVHDIHDEANGSGVVRWSRPLTYGRLGRPIKVNSDEPHVFDRAGDSSAYGDHEPWDSCYACGQVEQANIHREHIVHSWATFDTAGDPMPGGFRMWSGLYTLDVEEARANFTKRSTGGNW